MVAFVVSMIVTVAMTAVIVGYAGRRKVGSPLTWGEAIVASTYVFALAFIAYGVVPHQWLTWSSNELQWRSDRILLDTYPIQMSFETLSHIIVTGIYVAFFGGHIALWSVWQGRGKVKPAAIETSSYGRPLVKQS